jgi:hypothetical protein
MAATRAEVLVSLLQQLNHFDEKVGFLLRSNRHHIVMSAKRVADSQAQMERTEMRAQRRLRIDRALSTRFSRH